MDGAVVTDLAVIAVHPVLAPFAPLIDYIHGTATVWAEPNPEPSHQLFVSLLSKALGVVALANCGAHDAAHCVGGRI